MTLSPAARQNVGAIFAEWLERRYPGTRWVLEPPRTATEVSSAPASASAGDDKMEAR